MDPITAGLTAFSVGSSLFGLFGQKDSGKIDPSLAASYNQIEMQNSQLEQVKMNVDAMRRKRDIIRQAQVATANAENAAANSGALKSSGIEGARAGIFAQSAVNWTGVETAQEFGNAIANNQRNAAMIKYAMESQSAKKTNYAGALGGVIGDNSDELARMLKWGMNIK